MSKMFALGIALTAKDMFSPAFSSLGSAIRNSTKDLKNFGTATAAIGTGLKGAQLATQGAVGDVIKSFSDLEEAQTQLENTLMKSDGSVSPFFKGISDEATKLGNALPGTTADFYNMASKLKALGVEEQSIIGGALKSSAYLGVALKIPYEEAAVSTAKFKEALGIADEDLISFIDDIQRLAHTGVKVEEMSFAFSKVGATMKGLGMSGLEASREISPLIGMLIKSGFSGETVGTNLGNMVESAIAFKGNKKLNSLGIDLTFNDDNGKFLGFDNMVKEMEKLKAIESDVERLNIMEAIFGKGEAASMAAIFVEKGIHGISEYKKQLAEQADLMKRVENSTGTLKNMWEALTGTFTNVTALIGGALSPELKGLTGWLGEVTVGVGNFLEQHPFVAKFIGGALVGFVALTGGLGTAAIAVSMFTTVLGVLGVTSMATFGWIIGGITLIAGLATLLVAYWEPVSSWFSAMWESLFQPINIGEIFGAIVSNAMDIFGSLFNWIGGKFQWIMDTVGGIKAFFGMESNTAQKMPGTDIMAKAGNIPAQGVSSNSVSVTIQNPSFNSQEDANRTQAQIDDQVRKALREIERDKADRSYRD